MAGACRRPTARSRPLKSHRRRGHTRRVVRHVGVVLLVTFAACGATPGPVVPDAGRWFDAELGPCALGAEAPHSVDDVIARLNRLPRPLTVACFTASLPRPLGLVASSSRFSAQPAGGASDPRIFLFTAGTILSVVTAGDGKDLLEVAEFVTTTRTLKAEFKFPLEHEVTREDAYAHLDFAPTVSSCGLCHAQEEQHPAHRVARVSLGLKPTARSLVPLERLRALAAACDVDTERDRCLRWQALFGFGEVVEVAFPASFADFVR